MPRLWTPPLRELTPATTLGYDIIGFAEEDLKAPLDPWQQWTVIHAFELLPDGRTRFKKMLILVSRQNGKTHLCKVLCLYWMYVQRVPHILGTSTKLEYAKESWTEAKKLARARPDLNAEISHKGAVKTVNGGVVLWRADPEERRLETGSTYKIAPANEEGGRSQTNDRVIMDELRQHHDYSAWDAAEPTTSVPWSAMIIGASNAGSDRSVVLNDWRKEAVDFIKTGVGDYRTGLIEYSAVETAAPNDIHALAQANPNLNRRGLDGADLLNEAETAMRIGGKKLAGFRTEKMCIHVPASDPAVTPEEWADCCDVGSLAEYRDRVALVFDMSLDEQHVTLCAAAVLPDERVRLEAVMAWNGQAEIKNFARDFRSHVKKVNPRALGWLPGGPSAGLASTVLGAEIDPETGAMAMAYKRPAWVPRRTVVAPLRGEVPSLCMGFALEVRNQTVVHSDQELLNEHVPGADKVYTGSRWVVARDEGYQVDGYYAAAGAVYLARTVPPLPKVTGMILPS